MYIWGFAAGNFFSFLPPQEEPRVMANTGEQSKARSDKQKFRKDPFSKQEKRQVRRKPEQTYLGGWVLFVYSLFNVQKFFLQLLEIRKLIHKYAFSNTVLFGACVSYNIFTYNKQYSKYLKRFFCTYPQNSHIFHVHCSSSLCLFTIRLPFLLHFCIS